MRRLSLALFAHFFLSSLSLSLSLASCFVELHSYLKLIRRVTVCTSYLHLRTRDFVKAVKRDTLIYSIFFRLFNDNTPLSPPFPLS